MPRIVRLTPVEGIKPGAGGVAPDGTIRNPQPYRAVDIEFDDGATVQVERPLTLAKLQAAHGTAPPPAAPIDGFTVGQDIP